MAAKILKRMRRSTAKNIRKKKKSPDGDFETD